MCPDDAEAPAVERLAALRIAGLEERSAAFRRELGRVVRLSDFAFGLIQRAPEWLDALWSDGAPAPIPGEDELREALDEALASAREEAEWMAALRRFRHRHLLLVLWRDVNGHDELEQTLAALTRLADVMIQAALERAGTVVGERHGVPRDAEGEVQRLVVFGLGKLGGGELNFSSDVDLIAAYPRGGETDGGRSLDNQEFFARQLRLATRYLAERTDQGFVYRVDLRLRPFGDAGRLALSFAAMEDYYQREGRAWERYAWIKARPVAGDRTAGRQLLEALRPFVYRRYLDYSAFESLREMKAMIRAEVARRQLGDHIKLGAGGIREIEFIAQAFQLIRGGREPALRRRDLLGVLDQVARLELLDRDTTNRLDRAYRLFRRVENRLQQVSDAQTHRLPREPGLRQRIAESLDRDGWDALEAELESEREFVARTFAGLFETRPEAPPPEAAFSRLWDLAHDPKQLEAVLSELKFDDPASQAGRLAGFRNSVSYRALGERARQRFSQFMPRLLAAVGGADDPDAALESTMKVVRAIARRSAYVALLSEQGGVLERLVELCSASPWLTERLAQHPLLLDDLIDARQPELPERSGLDLRVHERLATVEAGDLEAEMEILRQIQQSQALVMAVTALEGRAEAPAIARSLSDLAEAILDAVVGLAWRDLATRHGEPSGPAPAFTIVGYGTLGGRELNFTSDLDLVFLHRGLDPGGTTGGERAIDNESFCVRVARRVMHLLTTLTASGRLYEVDVRLRPNGNAGFLVTGVDPFETYQREKAWTWELQALTRARPVAGNVGLGEAFGEVRRAILGRDRDAGRLGTEVNEMRQRMRAELDRGDAERFDLKQGPGGKVDIEFLSQWARLRLAPEQPGVLDTTSTLDGLEAAGRLGALSVEEAETLIAAYRGCQELGQKLALAGRRGIVGSREVPSACREAARIYQQRLG